MELTNPTMLGYGRAPETVIEPSWRKRQRFTTSDVDLINCRTCYYLTVLGYFSQFYAIPVHTTEIIQINYCLLVIGYPPHEVSLVHHTPSSLYSPKSALKSIKMPKWPFFDPLKVKFRKSNPNKSCSVQWTMI